MKGMEMSIHKTADELLEIARKGRPDVRYTRNRQGTAIAAWKDGQWRTVAGYCIGGLGWVTLGDLYINGEPCNKPEDWIPDELSEIRA